MISRTWQGYEIKKYVKGSRFPVYVKSIYRGRVTWTADYLYAKHYTETAAKRINKKIDDDIRAGVFQDHDILPDY